MSTLLACECIIKKGEGPYSRIGLLELTVVLDYWNLQSHWTTGTYSRIGLLELTVVVDY
jgi:hypothetical protein